MPTPPHRLKPDTSLEDNLGLINDNFDKTVQDISDLGAKFSGIGTFSAFVVANTHYTQNINVIDSSDDPAYVSGSLEVVPRVEVWVDNDGDNNYRLPDGGSLSAGQANAFVVVRTNRRPLGTELAHYYITIINFDSADHTFYVSTDVSYSNTPTTGRFR